MPRRGVEEKPPWASMPADLRAGAAEALGAPMARAVRVWGGYGPTPTFRLRLRDGRRVFLKATWPASNDVAVAALRREICVYEELGHVITSVAPRYYGHVTTADWSLLLLEDLGASTIPPWTHAAARGVARATAEWHASNGPTPMPDWVPCPDTTFSALAAGWPWIDDDEAVAERAAVAGPLASQAASWFRRVGPCLGDVAARLLDDRLRRVLLHGDVRSDNLRWRNGRLWLVDWPLVRIGTPEEDIVGLAQSVHCEGGPDPERVVGWYRERNPLDASIVDAAVVALAGFFVDQAGRPEIPGLPRLRSFQRLQLIVTMRWTAERLGLDEPTWLDGVELAVRAGAGTRRETAASAITTQGGR